MVKGEQTRSSVNADGPCAFDKNPQNYEARAAAPNSAFSVVIPTTGGATTIEGIKLRSRLRTSLVTQQGDYRPLEMSADYAHLISGPLSEHIRPGPYQLSLNGELETGRSWELPVALAHFLCERGALTTNSEPAAINFDVQAQSEPTRPVRPGYLIWATGKLDADLSPLPDEYRLDLKLQTSKALLERASADGQKIIFAIPPNLEKRQLTELEEAAHRWDGEVHILESGHEVGALIDSLIGKRQALTGPPEAAWPTIASENPARSFFYRHKWVLAGLTAVVILVGSLSTQNTSGVSNNKPASGLDSLLVERIESATLNECHTAIYTESVKLDMAPLRPDGHLYQVDTGGGLCGLRFVNIGDAPLSINLDLTLRSNAIVGSWAIFSANGQRLAPTWETIVYFASYPLPGDYKLGVSTSERLDAIVRLRAETPQPKE